MPWGVYFAPEGAAVQKRQPASKLSLLFSFDLLQGARKADPLRLLRIPRSCGIVGFINCLWGVETTRLLRLLPGSAAKVSEWRPATQDSFCVCRVVTAMVRYRECPVSLEQSFAARRGAGLVVKCLLRERVWRVGGVVVAATRSKKARLEPQAPSSQDASASDASGDRLVSLVLVPPLEVCVLLFSSPGCSALCEAFAQRFCWGLRRSCEEGLPRRRPVGVSSAESRRRRWWKHGASPHGAAAHRRCREPLSEGTARLLWNDDEARPCHSADLGLRGWILASGTVFAQQQAGA